MIKLAIIVLVLLVLLYLLSPPCKERFTSSVAEANLENNMDYIKDNKGYTLNDRILETSMLKGGAIESPYL